MTVLEAPAGAQIEVRERRENYAKFVIEPLERGFGITLGNSLRRVLLSSIPGGGAEILDDEVRHRIARLKCSTQDWVDVHRTAHELGMRTTATMMFGVGESFEHRVNHFEQVRRLQEETGGFTAFIPWSFQPTNTALGGRKWDEATS
ncbi:MAG: hypothetical protein ABSD03_06130, partial [Vulcanimicrobiaceae bacterium]